LTDSPAITDSPPTGVTRKIWYGNDIDTWAEVDYENPQVEEYYGGAETIHYRNYYCEELDGIFVNPLAGEYRFYTSCDGSVDFFFNKGSTAFDELAIVADNSNKNSGFRSYHHTGDGEGTPFTFAASGEQSRFTFRHCHSTGDDYCSIGMEYQVLATEDALPTNPAL